MVLQASWQFIAISALVIAPLFLFFIHFWRNYSRVMKILSHFEGPPYLPFLGNAINLMVDHSEFVTRMHVATYCYSKKRILRLYIGTRPYLAVYNANAVEAVLSSNVHITKSSDYNLLHPWLATGLLTSKDKKWKSRRRMLTPSFHFRILDNFMSVFNEQSEVLVDLLRKRIGQEIDIYPYMTNCSLDIICDSAMGRHVNAQIEESEYVTAIERLKDILHTRQISAWYWPDWIFNLVPLGREHNKLVKILHNFTDMVIREKKAECKKSSEVAKTSEEETNVYNRKTRKAFLDMLIESSQEEVLTDRDIREEVDTFMFEGHDTTSTAMTFALYLIGLHPKVQKKIQDELDTIFGDDRSRPVTSEDLKEMKYLDCVIKETMRIFPSVPIIGREIEDEIVIDGIKIPRGVTMIVLPYILHRDPKYFPNPDFFDPDRFSPENSYGRHPYAYVPFSAGPRNCIGQKFALMEQKVVLARFLQAFEIKSLQPIEDINPLAELILRPGNGVKVQLTPRKSE